MATHLVELKGFCDRNLGFREVSGHRQPVRNLPHRVSVRQGIPD
jgi:hypothetical protein